MAERTEISWAHSTFNPWIGCTRVSPGCDHCYAATLMDERYGRVKWGAGEARQRTKTWDQPRRWNKLAAASGQPWRVFCASLADVFDNEVVDGSREDLWDLIDDTPSLTWMLLTKRIGNAWDMLPPEWIISGLPRHVWLGITVVNHAEAIRDIPKLVELPAAVRWLSCEPLLGHLDLLGILPRLHWVIVGGESGHGARAMHPDWARTLRDDCAATGVPFHFKQWGEHNERCERVGTRAAGHLLDGIEHRAFPPVAI